MARYNSYDIITVLTISLNLTSQMHQASEPFLVAVHYYHQLGAALTL